MEVDEDGHGNEAGHVDAGIEIEAGSGIDLGDGSGDASDIGLDPAFLNLSHLLLSLGVWKEVLKAYLNDVSNRLLQLKCEETGGTFDAKRSIDMRTGLRIDIHCYLKNVDEATVCQAMEQTRALYAKRVREEIRKALISLKASNAPAESWDMLCNEVREHRE
jgi:hypothetical protein